MTPTNRIPGAAMFELIELTTRSHGPASSLDGRIIDSALREARRNGGELSRRRVNDLLCACCGAREAAPSLAELMGKEMRTTYPLPSRQAKVARGLETMSLVALVAALLELERLGVSVALEKPLSAALEIVEATGGRRARVTQEELDVLWAGHQRGKMKTPERVACEAGAIPVEPCPRLWTSPSGFVMHLEAGRRDVVLNAYSPMAAKEHRQELKWQRSRLEALQGRATGAAPHA